MPKITASAPVLLVRDVVASARYYQECIGFEGANFFGEPPHFCILKWDEFYLMLAQADGTKLTPNWKIATECGMPISGWMTPTHSTPK
jgi:hypothetical protein